LEFEALTGDEHARGRFGATRKGWVIEQSMRRVSIDNVSCMKYHEKRILRESRGAASSFGGELGRGKGREDSQLLFDFRKSLPQLRSHQVSRVLEPFLDALTLKGTILIKEAPAQPSQHRGGYERRPKEQNQETSRRLKALPEFHEFPPQASEGITPL
jgi:hypothetical protein